MSSRVIRCHRCLSRCRRADDWNVTTKAGYITEATCPRCQTPEENAEAEINIATLIYSTDALGRWLCTPRYS